MIKKQKLLFAGFALAAASSSSSFAQLAGTQAGDLFELSLDQLLDLQVTSVSKKSRPVSQTAAAVFVITNDDIRRSGVTSIPDALRLAPGVQVANIDGNKWAVTARGFNGQYSNKLLILMDGRTVYSPLFSGTFWDAQDTILNDIERIEVVRGPGATLWGSNAVNGVVNIITRAAADSSGGYVSGGFGNQERGFVDARYGDNLGQIGDYRVYAKFFERAGNTLESIPGAAADDWHQARVGFRADLSTSDSDRMTLQGDAYTGDSGETAIDLSFDPPFTALVEQDQEISGFNLLGRWEHSFGSGDQLSVQSFYDHEDRNWAFIDTFRSTFDLDVDYRTTRFDGHDLVMGLGYRRWRDDFNSSERLSVSPAERKDKLFSAFVQDDITLVADRLTMTLGLKLERNDYTGLEYQPNIRFLWTPGERRSLWASISRGVRIPGRADRDSSALLQVLPPGTQLNPVPIGVYANGNPEFDSEELLAYEFGFKYQASDRLAVDLAVYYNDYDSLRSITLAPPACAPEGPFPACLFAPGTSNIVIDNTQDNDVSAQNIGLEVALNWRPDRRWRVQGTMTLQHQDIEVDSPQARPEVGLFDSKRMASLRVSHNPRRDVDLDLWVRYQSRIQGPVESIDGYAGLDARVAWRPSMRSEIALIGRNLQASTQPQFKSESDLFPLIGIQRSIHLQLSVEF
ncbi:MAG: TonB-dependent receptor plug domain-containing protein [Congregibacter sp.]